VQLNHKDKCTR